MLAAITLSAALACSDPLFAGLIRANADFVKGDAELKSMARTYGTRIAAYRKAEEQFQFTVHQFRSAKAAYLAAIEQAAKERMAAAEAARRASPDYVAATDFQAGGWEVGRVYRINDTAHVVQVVDKSNMIVRSINLFWLEIDTEGVVDGNNLSIEGKLRYDGTKQYTTAIGGTKTVHKFSRPK